jgi:hypothetical protein
MTAANENLHGASAVIPRSADVCWRALIDVQLLPAWVPGLRRVRVVAVRPDGLPQEILFEFAASLTYSLVYSYDLSAREMRWEPRVGKRDAVRGFARLTPCDGGTRLEYGLEHGDGRTPAEIALGDPEVIVAAFSRWVQTR